MISTIASWSHEIAFWVIAWAVFAPFAAAGAVAAYYEWRYRDGIDFQRSMENGLMRQTDRSV